jgi:hypothetical protein
MQNPPQYHEWRELLTEREFKEVAFACTYAKEYNHGTAGHNRLLLIAKLVEILDNIEHKKDQR